MPSQDDHLQIGEFAELVGLSVAQLRRYDRLQLLTPQGRSASGYRYYSSGQTGAARVIALLRSLDMPIADVRRVLAGLAEPERRARFAAHRERLEARLEEVRLLLDAVDRFTQQEDQTTVHPEPATWLHAIPRLPVSDIDRSVDYYEQSLGLRVAWQTTDRSITAIASGVIELFFLVPWPGSGPVPAQALYVYVDDPDCLCAELEAAGATVIDPVASRPSGMRDFVVLDPDGHRFTLGRGEERLREVADYYGLQPDDMAVDPAWLDPRR